MTNHNHSNQWEKFVRTFFSLILFSSFFFQMHQGDSGGTLFGKDYAKVKIDDDDDDDDDDAVSWQII